MPTMPVWLRSGRLTGIAQSRNDAKIAYGCHVLRALPVDSNLSNRQNKKTKVTNSCCKSQKSDLGGKHYLALVIVIGKASMIMIVIVRVIAIAIIQTIVMQLH